MKQFFLIIFIMSILALAACTPVPETGPGPLDDFAKCIYDSGVRMYGSFQCSLCARERILFGSSFQYIQEIECHPRGENPQTELCFEKDVEKTPTWILEQDGVEVKRLDGYQPLDALSELSGCPLPS